MVEKIFICPYCREEYSQEEQAEDCAKHCVEIQSIKIIFKCEICKKEYEEEDRAEKCENRHKQNNDIIYAKYQDKLSKMKLEEAGNHPNQKRLR